MFNPGNLPSISQMMLTPEPAETATNPAASLHLPILTWLRDLRRELIKTGCERQIVVPVCPACRENIRIGDDGKLRIQTTRRNDKHL